MIGVLGRRGPGSATAEDAVQEAPVRAVETWPTMRPGPPSDPKGWLVTVA